MDYEREITIDETQLDIEWLEQPGLMLRYSRHLAMMRRELDKSKQDLDIAKAETDKDIRQHPEKHKLEKITEGAVAAAILLAKDYQDAFQNYLDAKFEADMAQGAVVAFEQRKTALENLVKLNGQQYFAGPKMPRDLEAARKANKEKQEEVNKKVGSSLKRRT